MKFAIPFRRWAGKAALEVEIPDDTGDRFRLRVAVEIAVKGGADLAGADLAGADLANADLAHANLANADLAGANLAHADLAGADLANANLVGADLAGANLVGANLVGANLVGANLANADLAHADLAGADLANANLAHADLACANLANANLAGGARITVPPLQLFGLRWPVIIFDRHIQIGCEVHETSEWDGFDDRRIAAMNGRDALTFWRQWKGAILAAAHAHQAMIKESRS